MDYTVNGIDVNATDIHGHTVVHVAARRCGTYVIWYCVICFGHSYAYSYLYVANLHVQTHTLLDF